MHTNVQMEAAGWLLITCQNPKLHTWSIPLGLKIKQHNLKDSRSYKSF